MSGLPPIAAFFDLDGTLLPRPSLEWRFIGYLRCRDKLGMSNLLRWLAHAGRLIPRGARQALQANKQYFAGLPESLVDDWAKSLRTGEPDAGIPELFAEGLRRIEWHQSQNHRVFLVSGTLGRLASCVAQRVPGRVEAIATELAISAEMLPYPEDSAPGAESGPPIAFAEKQSPSIWTGQLAGEHMVGAAKGRALRGLAIRHELDLAKCYAYGDSWTDRAMLEAVGYPEAVNPTWRLARLARARNWPVSRWRLSGTARGQAPAGCKISGRPSPPTAIEQAQS
jgi:phosphoserine phosphatase